MDRLETLRHRIRNLDTALLALAAERTELAREVGDEKRRAGIPLRDYEVEKRVLDRATATAGELGLDGELARSLVSHLIGEACRVQEIDTHAAFAGDAESVLVVGGAGRMGRWLVGFLASQGHRVRIFDPACRRRTKPTSVATLERGARRKRRWSSSPRRSNGSRRASTRSRRRVSPARCAIWPASRPI